MRVWKIVTSISVLLNDAAKIAIIFFETKLPAPKISEAHATPSGFRLLVLQHAHMEAGVVATTQALFR